MASAAPLFSDTKRFKQAVGLLSAIPSAKLTALLSRILSRLGGKGGGAALAEEEEGEVREMLGLTQAQLDEVVNGSSYIFETSAYHDFAPEKLRGGLEEAGMGAVQATTFARAWAEGREALAARLAERQMGTPLVLDAVDWRLQMEVGHQRLSKIRELKTVLNLGLRSTDDGSTEDLTAEFSLEQLQDLADQMDLVQSQLDALATQ